MTSNKIVFNYFSGSKVRDKREEKEGRNNVRQFLKYLLRIIIRRHQQ